MIIKIKRQDAPDSAPYWQSFSCDLPGNATVAMALEHINYSDDPCDVEGKPARRIRWECSCMQKTCGACAMVIDGKPALACDTFLRDCPETLTLEPLSKFPVVSDLIVDRNIIYKNLSLLYLEDHARYEKKEYEHQYTVAKCLKCGLCLEVCPNYIRGEDFFGALYANEAYLAASQSEPERQKDIRDVYKKNFAKGCSKALSCEAVCPMALPTLASMAKLNRRKI